MYSGSFTTLPLERHLYAGQLLIVQPEEFVVELLEAEVAVPVMVAEPAEGLAMFPSHHIRPVRDRSGRYRCH